MGELGMELMVVVKIKVYCNDKIFVVDIRDLKFDGVVIFFGFGCLENVGIF